MELLLFLVLVVLALGFWILLRRMNAFAHALGIVSRMSVDHAMARRKEISSSELKGIKDSLVHLEDSIRSIANSVAAGDVASLKESVIAIDESRVHIEESIRSIVDELERADLASLKESLARIEDSAQSIASDVEQLRYQRH